MSTPREDERSGAVLFAATVYTHLAVQASPRLGWKIHGARHRQKDVEMNAEQLRSPVVIPLLCASPVNPSKNLGLPFAKPMRSYLYAHTDGHLSWSARRPSTPTQPGPSGESLGSPILWSS